jgi:hypothetical protein
MPIPIRLPPGVVALPLSSVQVLLLLRVLLLLLGFVLLPLVRCFLP